MSNKKRLTALLLIAALLCSFALVGCGGQDDADAEDDTVNELSDAATTDDADDSSTDATDTTDDADENASQIVLGVVSAVGTNYLMLTAYTAPDGMTDYAALDIASLTETENTVFVYPTEDTAYYLSDDGVLSAAAATDVTEGDLIAETVSDDGEHQIIILTNAADTAG